MLSVNIRQLRETRRLKEWLRAGKTVELKERDRVIGCIVPAPRDSHLPYFASRRRQILGDRILPGEDILIE